jgi:hypothetical protein
MLHDEGSHSQKSRRNQIQTAEKPEKIIYFKVTHKKRKIHGSMVVIVQGQEKQNNTKEKRASQEDVIKGLRVDKIINALLE